MYELMIAIFIASAPAAPAVILGTGPMHPTLEACEAAEKAVTAQVKRELNGVFAFDSKCVKRAGA